MKILFAALHHGYFRNFESVIRELVARGHQVHLAGDEPEDTGGRQLAERLTAECRSVTWDLMPALAETEPWFEGGRKLRLGLDYVRMLEPRYAAYPKLRVRAEERAPRLARWCASVSPRAALGALKVIERLLPASDAMQAYLHAHGIELVVLASLTYSRSQQMDLLKAARALHVPVAAAIMSWDHLSSKALLHVHPDLVLVWNAVQTREAVEMHGLPADRVVATGAQCYDQWFTRTPDRSREPFCRAFGLRADRPVILWVHSALSPTPVPPEPVLVEAWLEALRASPDPVLREAGVIVRPHPERMHEWDGVDLTRFAHVAFSGRNPIDAAAKSEYFDALHHSGAVVGLVTSAFLEAVVVGRPILTLTRPEYRMHQEEMLHFQYLRTVAGGVLQAAPDLDAHLAQLSAALQQAGTRDERNRRFLNAFIRPAGIDVPATPRFADAIERLGESGPHADPALPAGPQLLQRVARAAAARADVGVMRYLLNDIRDDQRQNRSDEERRHREARLTARAAHRRRKAGILFGLRVRGAARRVPRVAASLARRIVFHSMVFGHRVLGHDVPAPDPKAKRERQGS